ncbi:anaerobic ribonucleoside-triphosphate reductase [Limosilactobacillus reuteri]|jgi:ribonucleoside-triphosphate reductase|uniref:Anaerobic ribonucleoside-triphosphate reductase n=1 Tax=Limosilactobacillus reuteri TaxID=1598 RepID=A0A4S2DQF1_LIMRT|nr:anaerobic ribonucleoside-triphosphate reductase [Limosilactobacillus reuteri]MCC4358718.1 anaerobic ribonucleoside-triphosphate reductase [Limosilactobacillus reuteri]MCC4362426.1 anaerobic ribonucleoside-triphosphate reductase [Limosilactobacillus reuteri]MCC4365200.1 anaerobic ribonucleoside-triphosphate reductase [Limosilactobacillus reuteri]MCC4502838.1 anaerobic ribonucleoside-triphosphate reductase [Limosilactobacillus reuteri]MCC4509739.1 anaerobic ribonucleoside-triphosphate reducta
MKVQIIDKKDLQSLTSVQVVKRDGTVTPFYSYKINLVLNALNADEQTSQSVYVTLLDALLNQTTVTTKKIADLFVQGLVNANHEELAKVYRDYRQHDEEAFAEATNPQNKLEQLFDRNSRIIHENANKDSHVFNTQRDLEAGVVSRALGLRMLPGIVAKAHLRGDIHWHDLDYSPVTPETNCCLIDFDEMFKHGFKIGNAWVSSPRSIQTATAQMSQIIANVASLQYGGCSANRIDQLLEPYAKLNYEKHMKDAEEWIVPEKREEFAREKTKKDIYDAMQALEYEINTLYSSQGQTPFTTINFGLGTSWIAREIQKAILKIRIKGLGKEHRTAIFPKLTFTIKRGLNLDPEDPNYDIKQLALECSTKRMYPDLLMYDKIKELTGSFKTPMGCRSFLQGWTDPETGKEVNSGRMNLGVVTVNLPRIALEAHGDKQLFWEIFQEKMNICKIALDYRIKRTKEAKPENAPLLYMYGAFGKRLKKTDSVDEVFKNSRATVSLGYIGLYEVCTTFYGSNWEHNKEAHDFAIAITKAMHDLCAEWEKEEGYHFSLYSTPAESLTDTFCQDDLKKFGRVEDVTDKEYYTNSFHYDVRKHPTPFEKLSFEEAFPKYAAGGFIHYCEYPNLRQNPKALEAVWDWAYDHVGYLGTNTSIDQCFKCGFKGEFEATARGFKCPQCGNHDPATCDVVKRTCGYLGNPQQRPMVHGRHEEIIHRVKHMNAGMIKNAAEFEQQRQMDNKAHAHITGDQI